MACKCNTPTFNIQTGVSISLTSQTGSGEVLTPENPQYQIQLSGGCCCGGDEATLVSADFIYDGTYFFDGTKTYL